jgi:hypothetical protein
MRLCSGTFGSGKQIGRQSVATALRHVSQAFVLASYGDPRQELLCSPKLSLAFTCLHHSHCNEDPAPKPQLALPILVVKDIGKNEGASVDTKDQALADPVVLALFFLLRVGKHAPSSGNQVTPATLIRSKDLQSWSKCPNGLMD